MGGVTCHGYSWKCMRLTSPRHAGTQGMGWLAEIRGKRRRLLLYVSRKSTSGVFYSLSFSQHHLPKFSGFVSLLPSIHFPQHDPSSFQWLRDGVHLSPPHTSPKETPACCELGKQRRASTNHFKWLFEWEIMENATIILSPHPCNTGEHHIGDVSAMESITAMGCVLLRAKTTCLSSNLEPLGRNILNSEPKQSMILNKPVVEKSTFVPYSKTVSSKET